MNILQLIQKPQKRGVEIFTAQLTEHLRAKGHQVLVVSVFSSDNDDPISKIKTIQGNIRNRFFDFSAWYKLHQIIKEFQPDVIQCNAADTLKYAVFSKLLFRWKTPLVFRNASTMSVYLKNLIQKKLNAFLLSYAKKIISVSNVSVNDLKKIFPQYQNKMEVIPIGVEENQIAEVQWQQETDGFSNIIHVGGFSFEKNHVGLLNIFYKLKKKNPNVHLHLLGEGILKREIERLVLEKGLGKSVSFYGNVSNPVDYIAKADVLVLTSIIEGLPAVVLEAMYVKTPVIAYNVGGIAEVIKHEETGFLINPKEEDTFVDTLLMVLNEKHQPTVNRAFHLVMNNFMNTKIAERFEETYKSLIYEKN